MRKFTFILPACAVLLAAAVLTSELSASLTERTPAPVANANVASDEFYDDDSDINAATWVETGKKNIDTRKPRLPPPKTTKKKKK